MSRGKPRLLAARLALAALVVTTAGTGAVAGAAPASAASAECATSALVAVNTVDAKLYRWSTPDAASPAFSARATVGQGWSGMRLIASDSTTGYLYAVDASGNLRIYTWTGSAYTGGSVVSTGWGSINQLVPEGNGVLLARDSGGTLRWYRWLKDSFGEGWAAGSGAPIGTGWGGFSRLFSGGNGIVYGVRSSDGALLWYRYRNPLEPVSSWEGPATVGSGWGSFREITGVGGGYLFATTDKGELKQYHHLGHGTGQAVWEVGAGLVVGSGWTTYNRLTSGPAACGRLDPPVNVRAFTGGDGVALRWNPPAGVTATSYRVYRDGAQVATVAAANTSAYVDTARFVDHQVAAGATRRYQIDVTTSAGTSVKSSAVSVTMPATVTPVPTLVSQAPAGYAAQDSFVRTVLRDWYPKTADVLARPSYSAPTALTFIFDRINYPGVTSGTTMTFDIDSPNSPSGDVSTALTNPNYPGLLLHEATHVVQQYPAGPGWVAEGLAVWATHNIYNDANTPLPVNTSYTAGYSPAAYLIRSASAWYAKPGLPRDLNVAAHNKAYTDSFFVTQTGHTLAELWDRVVNPRAIP